MFQIVGREDLTNAVALSAGLGTSARIIGPAVGGFVVAAAGPGVAFALNAVSYAIVICAILAMRLAPRPPHVGPRRSVLAGVGEALSFAVSSRRVAVTFFTVLLVSTFSFNFDVLLPLVAKLTLDQGAGTFGLIASVFGAGALCRGDDPRHDRPDATAGGARSAPSASAPRSSCSLPRTACPPSARSCS